MNRTSNGKLILLRLLAIVCVSFFSFGASLSSFQSKTNATDDLVRQLIEKFTDEDKKGIVVMDLEPATGQTSSFGAWVADQFSTSLAATGKPIEVIDRSRLAAALATQHLSLASQSDARVTIEVGKSIGAKTVIVGSYGAAENGIGVSVAAVRVSEYGVASSKKVTIGIVVGKIPLTQEVSAHLNVPVDSLRPKDSIYKAGYGGVSIPSCIKCTMTGMHVPDIDLQGMLSAHPNGGTVVLRFIVTPEGHTKDITVIQPIGYGYDEQYMKMAESWEFKPAVDADNKPVSVLFPFTITFNYK